jgi:TM2 domain-containing membrane protein YozV
VRFGGYRVFTFPAGSNNPTILAASRQQGLVCLNFLWISKAAGSVNQTFPPSKLRTNSRTWSYGILQVKLRGARTMRDPFTAGLLSFLIPGVGQIYNGRWLAGIFWLIITPGFWIGSGGTLGWICHIIAAYTAYSYAKDHPVRYAY